MARCLTACGIDGLVFGKFNKPGQSGFQLYALENEIYLEQHGRVETIIKSSRVVAGEKAGKKQMKTGLFVTIKLATV